MPRKPKSEKPPVEVLAPIAAEILDQIVRDGPLTAEEIETASRRFKKALIERALGGELTHHLGYPPGATKPELASNHRNGTSGKTVLTDEGPVAIEVPRDREGTFEPQLIGKHERRFTGFDDKVIALYARVDSPRDSSLLEGGVCRRGLARSDQHRHRRHRRGSDGVAKPAARAALSVVFFDALRVKIRDEATVRIKAVYLALAVLRDGSREILGIWIEQTEGAKFWMKVFTDLKARGCQDLLIAVTDRLKGMEEALAAVFPATTLQTCIVHLLRQSLDFANWKPRKPLAVALRTIYTAPSADLALAALDAFERGDWGQRCPTIVAAWRRAWSRVIPFFAFPPEIRRVIYTTNALESVHAQRRKIIKTRGHFPNDDAATKLIWLALRNIGATWERAAPTWRQAMNQFAILYGDRFLPPTT